jgi:hypothetical protein
MDGDELEWQALAAIETGSENEVLLLKAYIEQQDWRIDWAPAREYSEAVNDLLVQFCSGFAIANELYFSICARDVLWSVWLVRRYGADARSVSRKFERGSELRERACKLVGIQKALERWGRVRELAFGRRSMWGVLGVLRPVDVGVYTRLF